MKSHKVGITNLMIDKSKVALKRIGKGKGVTEEI
jgi:hypothetical protein